MGFGLAIAGMLGGAGQAGLERARAKREETKRLLAEEGLLKRALLAEDRADARAQATRDFQRSERLEEQKFEADRNASAKLSEKDKKILRAQETFGMSEQEAVKFADGYIQIEQDPVTKAWYKVDVLNGVSTPLRNSGVAQSSQPAQQSSAADPALEGAPTLWDQTGDATGFLNTLKLISSNTLGQIPGDIGDMATFPEATDADAAFDLLRRNMIQSFALNPRYPIAEQKVIEALFPRGPVTDPDTLRSRLREADRELARIIEQSSVDMQEVSGLDPETRKEAIKSNRYARILRDRLGVPQKNTQPPSERIPASQSPSAQSRAVEPDNSAAIQKARDAIQRGADPDQVRQRLIDNGIDPRGL